MDGRLYSPGANATFGGIAFADNPVAYGTETAVAITTGGFVVTVGGTNTCLLTNQNLQTYHYIAFL
jgi:hypothetical protein